jgi:hypothetical protein
MRNAAPEATREQSYVRLSSQPSYLRTFQDIRLLLGILVIQGALGLVLLFWIARRLSGY